MSLLVLRTCLSTMLVCLPSCKVGENDVILKHDNTAFLGGKPLLLIAK